MMRGKSVGEAIPESAVGCQAMNTKNLFSGPFPDGYLNVDSMPFSLLHDWLVHKSSPF
jgi:hypothetical protein